MQRMSSWLGLGKALFFRAEYKHAVAFRCKTGSCKPGGVHISHRRSILQTRRRAAAGGTTTPPFDCRDSDEPSVGPAPGEQQSGLAFKSRAGVLLRCSECHRG